MASLPKIRRAHERGSRPVGPSEPERPRPDVQRLEAFGLTWLNIESPTEREVAWLAEHYEFHRLDLEDVLSRRRQRPKIDEYPDYLFIVLHFPRFDKRTGRLQAAELNVFVADDLVITLPNEPLKPLSGLWSRCERAEAAREQHMSRGSGYLVYEIVDTMYDYCFPILDKIGFKLDAIEDALFEGATRELVRDISNTKQEIINFRKVAKPQRPTLRLLERSNQRYAPHDLEIYFDDIVDKSEQIWNLLENYKEVAEALEATNESVITHKLNDIIRVLTILSAIVLPLGLIASIYGMNVDVLPFAHGTGAMSLLFPLILMVALGGLLVAWFRHKRWL
jgi:magnesium transporter